jgi:trk system potassium uptake protein TrkA
MRILLIGLGSFGLWFARSVKELGHEVIAIERDEALADRFAHWVTRAVVGDGTDPAVLERAGARDVDTAVIGTAEDLSTAILATVALRDLGVEVIYAKVRSTNAARALDALDITEAVFPEQESGFRLAHRLCSKSVLEYTPIAEGFSMQELTVPDEWVGKTIANLGPRVSLGIEIIGVRDSLTGHIQLPPDPATPLKPSDSLVVAGSDEALKRITGD